MKNVITGALFLWAAAGTSTRAAEAPLPQTPEFNRDIRPILSDACFHCHGPDKAKRKAELRFDTEEGARQALAPGDPSKSVLLQRITSMDAAERMPPLKSGRKLSVRQIELVRRWIEQGAKWQKHWAFIPPRRPPVPTVAHKGGAEPRNPIDAFIRVRLDREGLTPSPEADKTTLLRRVTLDLTGLPPTLAEVDAFLADQSADAYEKVVDRLLASPRYGERMVLEWLDAARYADSNGYQQDRSRTMWRWRDWVIDALNKNMPFDQFTIEQLAGDLLPPPSEGGDGGISQKIATGFNRNHMLNGEGGRIAEESRVDYVVDRVDTAATIWLGLTLGCARCHDHKYDPFKQKEYYQLFAYFNNIAETGSVDRGGNAAPVLSLPSAEQTKKLDDLKRRNAELERQLKTSGGKPSLAPAEWQRRLCASLIQAPPHLTMFLGVPEQHLAVVLQKQALQKKLADGKKALEDFAKSIPQVMVMEERPQPRETFVLIRGAYDKYGEKVGPGVPADLAPLPRNAPGNRLGLARWLVDPAQPLTARVAVNRFWQLFFGAGLVKTTEDFGVQGEPPSHPELLDWLATEFVSPTTPPNPPFVRGGEKAIPPLGGEQGPVLPLRRGDEGGWNVKALHRLIVTSATYRQSSRLSSALRERDPDNRLLARGPRQRLSSFAIRDQALAVSGLLVEKLGGPPVRPYQPSGIWEEMSFGKIVYQQDKGEGLYRRSLYTFWRRTVGPTTMFDTSARQVCTVKPSRTNTPLQSLILLNDVTYVEAARVLAQRLLTQANRLDERLVLAYRLTTSRPPNESERRILSQSFERLLRHYQADREAALKLVSAGESPRDPTLDVAELAAYTGLASVILNLDEVISKE